MSCAMPAQWPDLAGRIAEDGSHLLPIRVYYEDTDAGGVVYHARYLQFCERARSDFLRLLKIRHQDMAAHDLAFVVRRMECDFRRPARLDDVLQVRTQMLAARGARLRLRQDITLLSCEEAQVPQTGPIFSAMVEIAVVDSQGRPQRLPAWAHELIAPLLAKGEGD